MESVKGRPVIHWKLLSKTHYLLQVVRLGRKKSVLNGFCVGVYA